MIAPTLDRPPPQDLDAERAVLGSMLIDATAADDVALLLRECDFSDRANGLIFAAMLDKLEKGKPCDVGLLCNGLKKSGDLDSIGGAEYLASILDGVPTAAHASHYAEIVRSAAVLRELGHAGESIAWDSREPKADAQAVMAQAESRIFAVMDRRTGTEAHKLADVMIEAMATIQARCERRGVTGLVTGFADLDAKLGGMRAGELLILAARPGMGKSALAANIAEAVADCNEPVLFVSLEMSRLELSERMLSGRSKVSSDRLRKGILNATEHARMAQKVGELAQLPLYIDDSPSRTVAEIGATARRLKRRHGLGLLVIDYLQLIEPDNPREVRQEQVAKISRRLKAMARELKVPVLCLAQLNRQTEASRENKPRLAHLRESGAIEQDADVVMFIHREEYYATNDKDRAELKGKADVIVAKQRNGPTGDVKLTWLEDFTRFANASRSPSGMEPSYT
jgi:replicative DNA helicase